MENNILVSVIIAVYNGEKYIDKSIRSILKQKLKEIEVIVVDDNSNDSTTKIIKKIKEKDSRIKLIELNKNQGPGNARNIGINICKGKYVTFCDADDWIEEDMLSSMINLIEINKTDAILCGYSQDILKNNIVINKKSVMMPKNIIFGNRNIVKNIPNIDYNKIFSFVCSKIYKTEILKKNKIKFNNKLFGEDYDFNLECFRKINSLIIENKTYYHYIKNRNEVSLTERIIPNFFENINNRFTDMVNLLKEKNVYNNEQKRLVSILFIKHMMACVIRTYSDKTFNFSKRYKYIKTMFSNSLSLELYKYADGSNFKEKIYCFIYKTQNILLMMFFNRIIYFLQKNLNTIFQRIK